MASSEVAIVGVGAIGGLVGGALAAAGRNVSLCSRRRFDRLVVEGLKEEIILDQRSITDPAQVGCADWVVVTTKVHNVSGIEPWLRGLCCEATEAILVLQNGLDIGDSVATIIESVRVIPVIVMCGAELLSPGRVRHHGGSTLIVPAPDLPLVRRLFDETFIEVEGRADFYTAAWRKLLFNSISGPVTALTQRRLEVCSDPKVEPLMVALLEECITVARASGADLSFDLIRPTIEILQNQPPSMGTSMLYDRLHRRPMEHVALTGSIVRCGRLHGVRTPLNDLLLGLLEAVDVAE